MARTKSDDIQEIIDDIKSGKRDWRRMMSTFPQPTSCPINNKDR
ncbi:hypothetical protein LCGC14_0223940 [marine sediment metagenome]|uniref:Uncharacterized protein n=1 Tax=marine sediment metagenome TaxID=412755 RepID=A0A0F9WWR5_9ZZZZ